MLINLMPRKSALTWTYEGLMSQIAICLLREEQTVEWFEPRVAQSPVTWGVGECHNG